MSNHTKTPFQQKIANLAYVLFTLGLIIAGTGQYSFHNPLMIAVGIIIIAVSLVLAIIANPALINF